MKLIDTIDLMKSDNYKNRFLAEYRQTRIRCEKLHRMIIKYHAGTLEFKPKCDLYLLEEQAGIMQQYLRVLEIRAEVEGIDIATLIPDTSLQPGKIPTDQLPTVNHT